MENKSIIVPAALALGIGLGVGMSTTLHNWNSATAIPSIPLNPSSSSSSSSSSSTTTTTTTTTTASSPFFEYTDDTAQLLHVQLISQVIDGHESSVTFDDFPYYLSEQTKMLLKNAACVHLQRLEYSKFTRNLSPASRTILLSGPAGTETYHQMLAKCLAHSFDAKLLILDVTDLSRKIVSKYGTPKESTDFSLVTKNLVNGVAQCVREFFSNNAITFGLLPAHTACPKIEGKSGAPLKREPAWPFEDKMLVVAIYKVLQKLSESNPTILYMRDVEKLILRGSKTFSLFQRMVNKLTGPIFILGSRVLKSSSDDQIGTLLDEKLGALFPYKIDIKAPADSSKLLSWKSQLAEDMKAIRIEENRNHISEVLGANDVECEDLDSFSFSESLLSESLIEEVVVSAISHHLMNTDKPQHRSGRLVISLTSLVHGLSLFQTGLLDTKGAKLQLESNPKTPTESTDTIIKELEIRTSAEREIDANKKNDAKDIVKDATKKDDAKGATKKDDATTKTDGAKDAPKKTTGDGETSATTLGKESLPDNEFEKRIRPEVIPAGEIGVSFHDIGALDEVKEVLQEVVMLPLQRPELFRKGGLIKPCKGVLLFGPPGTGKTMLAKAIATEAGASFINVSMSTITSKWFGEDEKNVKALFTLAAKVAPTIIFIDEVDSMLGQRTRNGEHEAMRKIKNEFMAHWDGLLSKSEMKILVLAATNRPFDLDDAIIRRFERRIMVGLPDKNNRERILKTILEKERVADDFNYCELATMTEGYSGSDLKNLCMVAAYRPLKEFLRKEKQRNDKNASETTSKTESITKGDQQNGEDDEKRKGAGENGATTQGGDCNLSELRPLNMEDMKEAKRKVSSSFAAEGHGMADLKSWNELFGEGGSRTKKQLPYFI